MKGEIKTQEVAFQCRAGNDKEEPSRKEGRGHALKGVLPEGEGGPVVKLAHLALRRNRLHPPQSRQNNGREIRALLGHEQRKRRSRGRRDQTSRGLSYSNVHPTETRPKTCDDQCKEAETPRNHLEYGGKDINQERKQK